MKNRGENKEKSKDDKINRLIWIIFIIVLIGLEIFWEVKPSHNYVVISWIAVPLSITGTKIWEQIIEKRRHKHRKKGKFWSRCGREIIRYINFVLDRPLLALYFLLLAGILLSSTTAHFKLVGKGVSWASGVMSQLAYNAKAADVEDTDTELSYEEEQPEDDSQAEVDDKKHYQTGNDFLQEEVVMKLTDEERAELYFLSGEYAIRNWEDEEQVLVQVRKFVEDKVEIKRHDDVLTMEYNSNAKEAEKIEKGMKGQGSLEEKKSVIAFRRNAWSEAETYTISKLIAKDYHDAALLAEQESGEGEVEKCQYEYYECQSIQWRFTGLEFNEANVDWNIHQIHTRYSDLMNLGIEAYYSEKLRDAFKTICRHEKCGRGN